MPRSILGTAALLLLTGCGAGWQRLATTPETTIPPREQALIYHGGAVERWHAARFTGDSISGIPWLQAIEGDTGRVALPLEVVDSVQVGDPSAGFRRSLGIGFGIAILWAAIWCGFSGCSST